MPRHGAWRSDDTNFRFDLWAPAADSVSLHLRDDWLTMTPVGQGWWTNVAPATHGDSYSYVLDDGDPLPDPAARWLPDGVHSPSAIVDPAVWTWTDEQFQAVPVTAAVIYELHIGAFTEAGTFAAATRHLTDLVGLGVTHVEVMPVNAFDGEFGWGYDGVAWWAVHQPYGGPDGFAAFVDACHAAGLAVILDVVHNHLGPSGNHLSRFGPYLQSGAFSTWGEVINLDGPHSDPVRSLLIGNALMWLRDHHVDGLRLDAVHALDDRGSATHILAQIADAVADLSQQTGRRLELIAETDRNDPQTIRPRALGGLGIDAQWADDLHHAIHVAVTGETDGYYIDYADPLSALAQAYSNGFVYNGQYSQFRQRTVGAPLPADVSLRRLIACTQNHDQVGNRAAGDRLTTLVDADLVRVATVLLCAAPHTPMLFMGQEYGETQPFQFFSDMPGNELRQTIRDGRRHEFEFFDAWQGEVPDPLDRSTFQRSKLDRRAADTDAGRQRRALWRDLLALRRTESAFGTGRPDLISATADPGRLIVGRRRPSPGGGVPRLLTVHANLSDQPLALGDDDQAQPTLVLSSADTRYGGAGHTPGDPLPPRSAAIYLWPAPDDDPARPPSVAAARHTAPGIP